MKNNVGAQYFVPLQSMFGAQHKHAPNFFSPAEAYLGIIEVYVAIIRYIQNSA